MKDKETLITAKGTTTLENKKRNHVCPSLVRPCRP